MKWSRIKRVVTLTLTSILFLITPIIGGVFSRHEGTYPDGYGVSLYVTPDGYLKTIGNDWDLNDDGWLDLVVINEFEWQDGNQVHDTYSYVFWGSSNGFERTNCDSFPTYGAECAALADFNRDGWTDIVVANSTHGYSYLIYGSQDGYTHAERDSFEAVSNHGSISVADLNSDGWLDLVWSSWYVGGNGFSHIYWGSEDGFDRSRTDSLPTGTAHGNLVADFDSDGFADILWAVYYNPNNEARYPSLIYWGSHEGLDAGRKTELPAIGPGDDLSVGDFNRDGLVDIIIPNHSSEPPPAWTYYDYSYVYYGLGNRQFSMDSLYAPGPWASSTADVNGDGWLDVIFTCSVNNYPLMYRGSAQGFGECDTLPSWKPACAQIADFDSDGDLDIALGSQSSSNLNILYQNLLGWDKKTLIVKAMDAGVTRDLGNPSSHEDEAVYISDPVTATHSTDSFAILTNITIDYTTDWIGPGHLVESDVELWISASNDHDSQVWGDWVGLNTTFDQLTGRSFRYKLVVKTGYRTSVTVENISLKLRTGSIPIVIQDAARSFRIVMDPDMVTTGPVIYDRIGRRVRTLSLSNTGYASWQGQDDYGNHLPAGVYFLLVPVGSEIESRKLMLLP